MSIKIHYLEKGQGNNLILLHGNGGNHKYFFYQFDEFSKYFHIFAIDTRGHGKTPRGKAEFTLKQFADDLAHFMDEKGIENADILGFSDGGNIAIEFVLKYPEKVNKLVLNGANVFPKGLKPLFLLPTEIMYAITTPLSKFSKKAKRRNELLSLMVNEPDLTKADLEKIDKKTLIVAGTKDLIKKEHTEYIARHIKNSEICFIKGDHSVANKKPEEFNKVVLDFLLDKNRSEK